MEAPKRNRWIAPAALAMALLSLALNGYLLSVLRDPAPLAAPAVGRALDRLGNSDAVIKYTVRVPMGTPLHFDIPFDQTYTVRMNAVFPINTTVNVPLRGPLGTYNVALPIRTRIPVRTNMPVRLKDTFRVRTQTQTEYVIPLEIRVRDLPLDEIRGALKP